MRKKVRASIRPTGQTLTLTKIDAAQAQLKAGVRMYFENEHIATVFTLANAVREVVGQIGEHLKIETTQREMADFRGVTVDELVRRLKNIANFLKHADRDPAAAIALEDDAVELVLLYTCHDFGRVAEGMPIEAQVFETWIYAAATERVSKAPLRQQQQIRNMIRAFPGLRAASTRAEQKRIGLQIMERALKNKSLEMAIRREVPAKPKSARPEK